MKTIFIAFGFTVMSIVFAYIMIVFLLWEFNPVNWQTIIDPFWAIVRIVIATWVIVYIYLKTS